MRMTVLVVALSLIVAGRAGAQDAIDLHAAIIHNSPSDVADWPSAAPITKLTMAPTGTANEGLSFESAALSQWPDYTPPGWSGPIEYTVWACANVEGGWHCAGFIQMWRGRPSTGAPMLTDWNRNWAYDANRWGALADFVPAPSSTMAYFLTAGNARGVNGVTSVRSRTNVVAVTLPAGDAGTFAFPGPATSATSAPPSFAPTGASTFAPVFSDRASVDKTEGKLPAQDLSPVLAQLAILNTKIDALTQSEQQFHAHVADAWQKTGGVILKYVLPAIGAVVAGRATK